MRFTREHHSPTPNPSIMLSSLRSRAPSVVSSINCRTMASKAKKKASKGSESKEMDQAQILMMKKALSLPKNDAQVPPELVAAAAEAAKDYSRYKMRKHHNKMGNLQKGLKLQQAAIQALPEHLAKAATEIDWNPFDMTRLLPTWTPPVKGYADQKKGV